MKMYYNKEKDVYIILCVLFLIGWIIFLIYNDCPLYWLPAMCAIPLIIMLIEIHWKRKYYIKRYEEFIEFTVINIEKYAEKTLKYQVNIKNILEWYLEKRLLIIITKDFKYEINHCYLKKEQLEKILDRII